MTTDRPKRALYLNKFGIMHKGIVAAVEDMAAAPDIDEIVLGVCSSQFSDRNPSPEKDGIYNCLGEHERIAVMKASLSHIEKPIHYVPIPDTIPIIKTFPENPWIDSVVAACPEFDVIYSERDVEMVSMQHRGKEVRPVPKHVAFSDHCIRDKIARQEIWEPFFSEGAVWQLGVFGAELRYMALYAGMHVPDLEGIDHEWRSFDQRLASGSDVVDEMRSLPLFDRREEHDTYILSLVRTGINMKFRGGGIKVKELLKSDHGLEQYTACRFDYPVSVSDFRDFCRRTRFPVVPGLPDSFTEGDVRSRIPDFQNPYFMLVDVHKQRDMHLYEVGGSRVGVEVAQVRVAGGMSHLSVALEAKSKEDLIMARDALGLIHYAPMNYNQFLERQVVERHGHGLYENMWVG